MEVSRTLVSQMAMEAPDFKQCLRFSSKSTKKSVKTDFSKKEIAKNDIYGGKWLINRL
ncbi:MAG: hypothetical protein H6Q72_3220 [Firmicutes bacterium]|nr:hypothetical protein [Bacillota bacterium]